MKNAFMTVIAVIVGFLFGCLFVVESKSDKPTVETLMLLSSLHNDEWQYELKLGSLFNDQCFNRYDIRLVRGYWWASVQEKSTSQSLNHRFSFRELGWINDALNIKLDERERMLLDERSKLKKASKRKQLLHEHENADELLQSIFQQSSQYDDPSQRLYNQVSNRIVDALMRQLRFSKRLNSHNEIKHNYIWDTQD